MRITDAKVIVTCPGRNFVTLKLTTEDGLTGLGDATLNGRELAVASYLEDHLVPLLIGRDARRIEDTWQYLYKGAYWRRGPVTMAAIAAVDTALWDIKAKAADMPVYELLGGASREAVLVYGHANGKDTEDAVSDVAAPPRPRLQGDPRPVRRARPGLAPTACRKGSMPYEPAEKGLPSEHAWSTEAYVDFIPHAVRARPRRVRPRAAPAARRASPADADRGGPGRQEPRAVPPVLDGGSGAGGAAGRLPRHPPAHDDADRGRRGLQLDPRLPAADHRAADRLHPHDRRARRRHHAPAQDRARWPSCTTSAPAATAPPI